MTRPHHTVALVANSAWYLANFRLNLARHLVENGADVVGVSPADEYVDTLTEAGIRHVEWPVERRGLNPLREARAVRTLFDLYRQLQPDIAHHFTIKPILYGTTAAVRARVPRVINSVTGLGHLFVSRTPATRLLKPAVRRWLTWCLTRPCVETVFQNPDDRELLESWSPQLRHRASLTGGSGVDLERFVPNSNDSAPGSPHVVLFVGRLLEEKGIHTFHEAARMSHQDGRDWRWRACGDPDPGNPSSITPVVRDAWIAAGDLELPGHIDPIDGQVAEASLVVLPSHREGTPRVLLEAAASGKPMVATDVPGCREVVQDGRTGHLVPPNNPGALYRACCEVLDDPGKIKEMGAAARRHAEGRFDERQIIAKLSGLYSHPGSSEVEIPGTFVMSLDLELAWGTRGRPAARHVTPFLEGTRDAVRGLIARLDDHGVRATWATVAALLLGDDTAHHPSLSQLELDDVPVGSSRTQPHWFAEDLIEMILGAATPQEIGCHTLSHPLVTPGPEGRERFRYQLERSLDVFAECHLPRPTSFIFPKAHMAHFDLLAEMGFTAFRGPESGWFESLPGRLLPAGLRWLDARLRQPPAVRQPFRTADGLCLIPASQFYSPVFSVGRHVSVNDRVAKAVSGLRRAAREGGVFHLWTHPFNLGHKTSELLDGLDRIFAEARQLADAGRLQIRSMDQLASTVLHPMSAADAPTARTPIVTATA